MADQEVARDEDFVPIPRKLPELANEQFSSSTGKKAEAGRVCETINTELLLENYAGLRRAIAGFLKTDEATSVLQLHRCLTVLDKLPYEHRDVGGERDEVIHESDPEYAKFSVEVLCDAAKTIRAFANKFSTGDAPLPLSAIYHANFREASPDEINGLDGKSVLLALFKDVDDDTFLKEVITEGFMENNPSVPSRRKIVFQVVIRGAQVGIFSDAEQVVRLCDRIPYAERRGCKTYFDAFTLFMRAWLRGDVGVFVPPGSSSNE